MSANASKKAPRNAGSSKSIISLLEAYKELSRPEFLSLYHSARVAAGGELPSTDYAASQLFPSISRNRTEWKAANFSELTDIVEIIDSAIKNGKISVYKRQNMDAAPVEINTREFINKPLEFSHDLEDIKSGDITHRYIYFKTDEVLSIFLKKKSSFANPANMPAARNRKAPGKAPEIKEKVKRAMVLALKNGLPFETLRDQGQESLKADYGCSRETACRARDEVLEKYPQE